MNHAKIIIKIKNFYFLLCWSFFIFYTTTFSFGENNEMGGKSLDKIFHLVVFFIFTYFLYIFLKTLIKNKNKTAIVSIIFSFLYIIIIEYLQIFIPGRFFSYYDILFGAIGSMMSLFLLFNKKWYNNKHVKEI